MLNKKILLIISLIILINSAFAQHSIIVISKDYDLNTNLTIYETGVFYKEINYGDSFNITNNKEYTILIHEDKFDEMSNIENINNLMNRNITMIIFLLIISMIIGLLFYTYKRSK